MVFRTFLRCEYSEENILFWLACEDLKKERSPELIEEKVRSRDLALVLVHSTDLTRKRS